MAFLLHDIPEIVVEVVDGLGQVQEHVQRNVHAVDDLVSWDEAVCDDNSDIDDKIEDPDPHALCIEPLNHPYVMMLSVSSDQLLLDLLWRLLRLLKHWL